VWWRRRYERRFGNLDERPDLASLPTVAGAAGLPLAA
jgi:hypothetical protein